MPLTFKFKFKNKILLNITTTVVDNNITVVVLFATSAVRNERMQPDIDDLNKAYRCTRLMHYGNTFLQAYNNPLLLKQLIRIAENAAKTSAEGKPAPRWLEWYGD